MLTKQTAQEACAIAAEMFGLRAEAIRRNSPRYRRDTRNTHARRLACHLLRNVCGGTLCECAEALGGFHYSTIIHHLDQSAHLEEVDPVWRQAVRRATRAMVADIHGP